MARRFRMVSADRTDGINKAVARPEAVLVERVVVVNPLDTVKAAVCRQAAITKNAIKIVLLNILISGVQVGIRSTNLVNEMNETNERDRLFCLIECFCSFISEDTSL